MDSTKDIVIVGGSIAGMTACAEICKRAPENNVTIFSDEDYPPYRRPGILSCLRGGVQTAEDLSIFPQVLESNNVEYYQKTKVTEILPSESKVKAEVNGKNTDDFSYDSLILTMGADSSFLSLPGSELSGVFSIRSLKDIFEMSSYLENCKKVTIVGAGFVALLAAEALLKQNIKPQLVVRSRILRVQIPPYFSKEIKKYLERQGVEIIKGGTLKQINGKNRVGSVQVNGKEIDTDAVIFCVGVDPSVQLAEETSIRVKDGLIDTNNYMQTSIPNIYAAGDCVDSLDAITKESAYVPTAIRATKEAKIAGINAAKSNDNLKKDEGTIRSQFEDILGLKISSMGYTPDQAKKKGINSTQKDISKQVMSENPLGENNPLKASMTLDQEGKIIGMQMFSLNFHQPIAYYFLENMSKGLSMADIRKKDFSTPWQYVQKLAGPTLGIVLDF